MHVVLLVTVPRTATRLFVKFFKDMPYIIHEVSLEALAQNPLLFHDVSGMNNGVQGLVPGPGNLVVGHFYPQCIPHIKSLTQFWRPVSTVVDPLFTLLSHHQRTMDENRKDTDIETDGVYTEPVFMAYMWMRFTNMWKSVSSICIPVDLLTTTDKRLGALQELVEATGVRADDEYIKAFAEEWPMVNTLGDYPLKTSYLEGDLAAIEAVIPEQVAILKAMEPSLRPMLEKMGYKDLMWWS